MCVKYIDEKVRILHRMAVRRIFLQLQMLIFKALKNRVFHSLLQNSPINGLRQLEREQNKLRCLFMLLNIALSVNTAKIRLTAIR